MRRTGPGVTKYGMLKGMPLTRRAMLLAATAPLLRPQTAERVLRRRALLIGNQNYRKGTPLLNPHHDVADLKDALESFGFAVDLHADLARDSFADAIDKFVRQTRPGDAALFYYSGHGCQIERENLLLPIDFEARTAERAREQGIALQPLHRRLRSIASLSLLILDACNNNPFPAARSWERGLAMVEAELGSLIAFAAGPGQTASDNPDERNGLFTKHLLAQMARPPALTELFRRVSEAVYQASEQSQRPYVTNQLTAEFYFQQDTAPAIDNATQDLLERGRESLAAGACTLAFEALDLAVRQNPENALAQNAAGLALACLGRQAQAVQRFSMAVRLDPRLAAAYWNRGNAYFNAGSYELAIEDYTWAIEQDPLNAGPRTQRGWAHLLRRDNDEARADLRRAAELNPSDAAAFHGLGLVQERFGEYSLALQGLLDARERNPGLPGIDADIERVQSRVRR